MRSYINSQTKVQVQGRSEARPGGGLPFLHAFRVPEHLHQTISNAESFHVSFPTYSYPSVVHLRLHISDFVQV